MNLHQIVAGSVGAINPLTPITITVSTGSTINPDGSQTPTYAAPVTMMAQVQPIQFKDIVQLDGLNIQGVRRVLYITGDLTAIIRVAMKGGDLVTLPPETEFPQGSTWLVAVVLEHWPDWVKVAIVLQDGS